MWWSTWINWILEYAVCTQHTLYKMRKLNIQWKWHTQSVTTFNPKYGLHIVVANAQ